MNTMNAVEGGEDHFERLPDALILVIFSKVSHAKYLLRCFAVRKRFASLLPQTDTVIFSILDEKNPNPIISRSSFFHSVVNIPLRVMFPAVMKFTWVRSLRIEFPSNYSNFGPSIECLAVMGARFKIAVFILAFDFHEMLQQGFKFNGATADNISSFDNVIEEHVLELIKNIMVSVLEHHCIAQTLINDGGLPALAELVICRKGFAKLCMDKEEIVELRNKLSEAAAESELSMSEVIGVTGRVGVKLWGGINSAMVAVIKPEDEEIMMERDVGCILGAFGGANEDDDCKEHGKAIDEVVHIMKQMILANQDDEASFQTHQLQVIED